MRHLLFVPLCFVSVGLIGNLSVADDFRHGALACVVEVVRIDPKQTLQSTDGLKVTAHSSAFVLGDGQKGVYLVTAAHNLINCSDVQINHPALGTISLMDDSSDVFEPFAYVDMPEDIAVFQFNHPYAEYFNRFSEPSQQGELGRVVGQLYRSKKENGGILIPRGGTAAAAGTIDVANGIHLHPAYSCTISRYVLGIDLKPPLNSEFATVSSTSALPLDRYRREVVKRIDRLHYLIVESMSITAGFSGSPIMISNDHFVDNGDVIGIVLGGKNAPGIGRSAWAASSQTIKNAISAVASGNSNNGVPGWNKFFPSADCLAYEDPKETGRWILKRPLSMHRTALGPKFETPYFDKFSIESRVEFRFQDRKRLGKSELQTRLKSLSGQAIAFHNIIFDETALDDIYLLTPSFHSCLFQGTRFVGSVLTGPTFEDCVLTTKTGLLMDIHRIAANKDCAQCTPAAVVAAIFKRGSTGPSVSQQTPTLLAP